MTKPDKYIIQIQEEALLPLARQYAQKYNLQLVRTKLPKDIKPKDDCLLSLDKTGLSLKYTKEPRFKPLRVDFIHHKTNYPQYSLLAKAVGYSPCREKQHSSSAVLDLTAGFGQDAFLLASLGYQLTLTERSPIAAVLLEDGLQRAKLHDGVNRIIKRMNFLYTDGLDYLQQQRDLISAPDVICLDPMFSKRKQSAHSKKPMQILQAILYDEKNSASQLLEAALETAKKRVVLKRHQSDDRFRKDQTAGSRLPKPGFSYKGKSCQFDVYLKPKSW